MFTVHVCQKKHPTWKNHYLINVHVLLWMRALRGPQANLRKLGKCPLKW